MKKYTFLTFRKAVQLINTLIHFLLDQNWGGWDTQGWIYRLLKRGSQPLQLATTTYVAIDHYMIFEGT